jgi:ATP-dependent Lhr-like helicase
VFTGFPGKRVLERHTRVTASLLFDVFRRYDPDNRLLEQAYDEVFNFEVEESRLVQTLERIQAQRIVLKEPRRPTPFAFPILTDRLREKSSNESMEKRVQRMLEQLEKVAAVIE